MPANYIVCALARREWLLQVLALAAAGCRRTGDPAYARGSTLVMAVNSVEDLNETPLAFLRFPRLAAMDANGELEPRLAQSWERSADYREWTYYLRTDVRWDDGKPVTAHDVKFTLDLLSHPDVSDPFQLIYESVTVLDDFTVKIRMGGLPYYQDDMAIYPKHVLEHLEPQKYYDWDFWLHPTVSAGPYRFVRYEPETMMELEANPDYYKGKPKIERVVLKFMPEGGSGIAELLAGNVDVIGLDFGRNPELSGDPRFRVYQDVNSPEVAVSLAIYWQNNHPLFRDPRVRRALTLGINRRELLQVANLPGDLPIFDGPFTWRKVARRQLPEPLPYDPDQARALLEAAGWRPGATGSVRERDGRPFRFTARIGGNFERIAVYVQDQLRGIGVEMQLQNDQQTGARVRAGTFEAAFSRVNMNFEGLKRAFAAGSSPGYHNVAAAKLIDRLGVTTDPDAEEQIYREVLDIFRADPPATFLLPRVFTVVVRRRLRGLSSPWRGSPYMFMEDLWLDDRNAIR